MDMTMAYQLGQSTAALLDNRMVEMTGSTTVDTMVAPMVQTWALRMVAPMGHSKVASTESLTVTM